MIMGSSDNILCYYCRLKLMLVLQVEINVVVVGGDECCCCRLRCMLLLQIEMNVVVLG